MKKLVRITTVPISLEKLLEGQLTYMSNHFDVTAISSDKERLERFGRDNGVATKHIPLTRQITLFTDIRALWLLYRYLRKHKPAIVHSHTPKAGLIGMMAAWLARVPHRLHTIAGLPVMEAKGFKRRLLSWIEKLTYAAATKVYPNSKVMESYVLERKWLPLEKSKVLHNGSSNGIDCEFFDPSKYSKEENLALRRELGMGANDLVFIYVGRLVIDKGINELVASFKVIHEEFPNTKLLLVGPFEHELYPLEPETLEAIEAMDSIVTTGYQVDVRPYFAISDILAFPSYREGFPNVVMQAGAMDLAAIVTDINGCNEIITHMDNGLIIPVKDVASLTDAMRKFTVDQALLQEMKASIRADMIERFDRKTFWRVLLKEYDGLFE